MKPQAIKLCLCCCKVKSIPLNRAVCADCFRMTDRELHAGLRELEVEGRR